MSQAIFPKHTERRRIISPGRYYLPVFSLTIVCGNCGAENREEANYCLRCGQSVFSPPKEMMVVASAMPAPVEWRPPLIRVCLFHPTLPANFNCAGCGASMCFSCTRSHCGAVFCPVCYSSRIGTWVQKTHRTYFDPFAPRSGYGARSVLWLTKT